MHRRPVFFKGTILLILNCKSPCNFCVTFPVGMHTTVGHLFMCYHGYFDTLWEKQRAMQKIKSIVIKWSTLAIYFSNFQGPKRSLSHQHNVYIICAQEFLLSSREIGINLKSKFFWVSQELIPQASFVKLLAYVMNSLLNTRVYFAEQFWLLVL